jgi:MFS family permease
MIVFSIGEVMIIPAEFLLVDSIAPEAQRGAYHGAMGFAALGSAIGPALGGGLLVWFGGAQQRRAIARRRWDAGPMAGSPSPRDLVSTAGC